MKQYRKKNPLSYALGAYPTMELILHAPELLQIIYTHPKIDLPLLEKLRAHAKTLGIKMQETSAMERLSGKGNIFVAASFVKQPRPLDADKPHLVLVNPSNVGNLGTILRSALGWEYRDIALIEPAADPFHPNCVRASMGSLFQQRIWLYKDFSSYQEMYPHHTLWSLMTRTEQRLEDIEDFGDKHSFILGNESSGLPEEFADITDPVTIDTSDAIDSLNITLAAAIAMHQAYSKKRPIRG